MHNSFLFEQALKAAKLGNRQSASQLLRQFLETNPDHELAWLWLGSLSGSTEEKMRALYEVLRINPDNAQAHADLNRLRLRQAEAARQEDEQQEYRTRQAQGWLKLARKAEAEGSKDEALELLLQYTQVDENDPKVWVWISRLAAGVDDKVIALENALRLDPDSEETKTTLRKLRAIRKNPLALGMYYEELGDLENAVNQYMLAERQLANREERIEAHQRRELALTRLEAPGFKLVSPALVVARLTAGPVLLYFLLLLAQSGFNLLAATPTSCVAGLAVPMGGFLMVMTGAWEVRHAWQNGLRKLNIHAFRLAQAGFWLLGLALMLLPFLLILIEGYFRI